MINKILITGGAGYIGSKISYDLVDLGFDVYIIDNLSTGHKILINKKATFFYGDILDYNFVNNILRKKKISNIMHLAASLSVEESETNPIKYYKNNVEGTQILLKAAVNNNLKNFIFSSTCAVYGNSDKVKVNEKTFCNPVSTYGRSKLLAELIVKNFSEKYNFKYGILRYFNVAGADEKLRTGLINCNDQLFKNLSLKLIRTNNNIKINVYGNDYPTEDGTCVRDYISVTDISKMHILILKHLSKEKSIILNCGYGKGYSVLKIVKEFERISGKRIKIIFKKRRQGDVSAIINNINLAKKIYRNMHTASLSNIIQTSLNWEKLIQKK
jgi:UDP-glucose 4-epimerase